MVSTPGLASPNDGGDDVGRHAQQQEHRTLRTA